MKKDGSPPGSKKSKSAGHRKNGEKGRQNRKISYSGKGVAPAPKIYGASV